VNKSELRRIEIQYPGLVKAVRNDILDRVYSEVADIHPYASGSNESASMQEACLWVVSNLKEKVGQI